MESSREAAFTLRHRSRVIISATVLTAVVAAGVAVPAASPGGASFTAVASSGAGGSARYNQPRTDSPAGSRATGTCSRAEAQVLARKWKLGDSSYNYPVERVLCGPFTGANSNAIAFSFHWYGCIPFSGWAVFRFARGDWQLVLKRSEIALLSAAGPDIRTTVTVFRPGDARCLPSGGKRVRSWHWNGRALVPDAWRQVTPAKPAGPKPGRTEGYFKTPSGNIVCFYYVTPGRTKPFVGCGIHSGLKPPPPRRTCSEGGYNDNQVFLPETGPASVVSCAGDPGAFVGERTAQVLAYGKSWRGAGLRCTSQMAGLTCRNRSGHGFFLSRGRSRTF